MSGPVPTTIRHGAFAVGNVRANCVKKVTFDVDQGSSMAVQFIYEILETYPSGA
jgi:hypothetical protein